MARENMAIKYAHTHKYERVRLGKKYVYKCALPNCPHYVYKELAKGRVSICWRCGDEFVMNTYSVQLAKPHCKKCHRLKSGEKKEYPDTKKAMEFLDTILPGVVK
jgi:hypothetical protein